MTDKVQKIREEVGKRYEYWREKESNSHSIESEIRMSECKHLLLMLDSLQEEPVSEDLEEAAEKYAYELFPSVGVANTETELAFKAGAKWQKEKMVAKAADATIGVPYHNNRGGGYIHLVDVSRPLPVGDNKITIIFKED